MVRKTKARMLAEELALEESIGHWEDIVRSLRRCVKNKVVVMIQIHEICDISTRRRVSGVGSNNCSLCQLYVDASFEEDECKGCPLHEHGNRCSLNDSLWRKVVGSTTTKQFLKNSINMRETLKSFRKPKAEKKLKPKPKPKKKKT